VKLESHRTGLDVSNAGEQEGGEDVRVRQSFPHARTHFLDQAVSRRLLDEADERVDRGIHAEAARIEACLFRSDRRKEVEIAESKECRARQGGLKERPA